MRVSIDADVLASAIKTSNSVTNSATGSVLTHFRVLSEHTLQVSCSNKGMGVALTISCKQLDKSKHSMFSMESAPLLAAIGNRKGLELEIGVSTVKVTASRYKVELVTTAAEAEAILPKEIKAGEGKSIKLKQDMIDFIGRELKDIDLKPMMANAYMPIAIRATDKGTIMVCYDNWHMASVRTTKVTGDLEFFLPISSLSLLVKEFKDKSYKMVITDTTLYAYNDSFELALTLPQQDSQNVIPMDDAFNLSRSLKKEKGIDVALAVEDIQQLAKNMEAVYKHGENIDFEVSKDSCKIMMKSSHGKIASIVRAKATKAVSFRVGFGFLQDVLTKVSGKRVDITVIPEKMMFFSRGDKTYMLAFINKTSASAEEE